MKWTTTTLPSKTDLTYEIAYHPKFIPVRSSNASLRIVTEGGKTSHLMFNFGTGLYYELDEASKAVWEFVNGQRSVAEIQHLAEKSGKVGKPDEVVQSLIFFAEAGLLNSLEDVAERKRVRVVSSFITEVTLLWNATRIFKAVHRVVRPVMKTPMLWASMLVVAAGVSLYAPRFLSVFGDARNFQILGSSVVGFLFYNYIILGPIILIHELSHGLALVHYTGKAGEVGTGLFYFGPMFYVDIAGYWSLPRRERIMIMWSGNLSTLLIGSSIVLIGLFFEYPAGTAPILNLAAFWSFYLTLWNLAPPFETDGYHILSDIVNQPNLRSDAFSEVRSTITRLFRRGGKDQETIRPKESKVLFAYAAFALLFLGFIGFQTLRFTSYMAYDAASWTGRVAGSILPGEALSPFAYAVGITTIGYFSLTLSGYGVLLRNQFRKLLARGLQFEVLHDRDFSAFFYVPGTLSSRLLRKLQAKVRSAASAVTSNFSLGHEGLLYYANLRIGGTRLPISQVKPYLRKVEKRFFHLHQELIDGRAKSLASNFQLSQGPHSSLGEMLTDMADCTPSSERPQVRIALREFLRRQDQTMRYLITSTFATLWTIEVPPAGQYELLTSLLPGLTVEDLIMTDLPDEAEEFKKQIVYGLDSIADVAAKTAEELEAALSLPEKHQLVASVELIRGRIIFVGRTEWAEAHLVELGSLFSIQAWSGYVDNLLADTSLQLHSIYQSLPPIPRLKDLKDGEVRALERHISQLDQCEESLHETLDNSREVIRRANLRLRRLKALFRSAQTGIKPFSAILELNAENLASIPQGIREVSALSRRTLSWARALNEPLKTELQERRRAFQARRKKIAKSYTVAGPVSLALVAVGLFQSFPLSAALLAVSSATQAVYAVQYYLVWSSYHRVPHYSSPDFGPFHGYLFALARTLGGLLAGLRILSLDQILEKEEQEQAENDGDQPVQEPNLNWAET